ncbi:MAG: nucleotidyltransferase family protein [Thiotrichaceae bacterium]|nr:nucleotidyltransferase family protein [Thiotrichaceae bacterium]
MHCRTEILNQLEQHRAEIVQRFKVKYLALFGSAARDELRENSDIDVLVTFDSPTFSVYLELKRYLEDLLHRKIDLVTETGLKPRARIAVQKDLIRVA